MLCLIIAINLVLWSFSTPVFSRDFETIKQYGVIRLAADGATPGFNSFKDHKLTGIEIDLAETLASRLGLRVEWKVVPFNSLLIGLKQDHFDLVASSHMMTKARKQVVDFVLPHYCTSSVIVSKINGPKSVADLRDKKVAVAVGTVYYDFLKNLRERIEIQTLPGEIDGLQSLMFGRSDAWVTEKFVARTMTQKHPGQLVIGAELAQQTNAMAVQKGNRTLLDLFNQKMKEVMTDGTYLKMSQKYFGQDIRCQTAY
jgi:polar amino acid transport system substrate-binding protein